MTRYINYHGQNGIETVDQLELKDFESRKAFNKELKRLLNEYRITGMDVYHSQRCTKDWKTT